MNSDTMLYLAMGLMLGGLLCAFVGVALDIASTTINGLVGFMIGVVLILIGFGMDLAQESHAKQKAADRCGQYKATVIKPEGGKRLIVYFCANDHIVRSLRY